jgi:hypothetical protein
VVRTRRVNLDLGVAAAWRGYAEDRDNGYDDPGVHERCLARAGLYLEFSAEDGIGTSPAAGAESDDGEDGYWPSRDLGLEGTVGLYGDPMLRVRLAASTSDVASGSSYPAWSIGASLTRRF